MVRNGTEGSRFHLHRLITIHPHILITTINNSTLSSPFAPFAYTIRTGAVALVLSWITRKEAGDWKCESLSGEEQISQRFTLHVIRMYINQRT